MCEICDSPSKDRICEECMELLDYVDASVFNRFVNSLEDDRERRPRKRDMELDYEDTS